MTPPEPPIDEVPPESFKLLEWRFWAALVFLVVCVIAGVVVALCGPTLWPRTAPHPLTAHGPKIVSQGR